MGGTDIYLMNVDTNEIIMNSYPTYKEEYVVAMSTSIPMYNLKLGFSLSLLNF